MALADLTVYPRLSINLLVADPAEASAFYTQIFGATERSRLTDPKTGRVGHAELDLDGHLLLLAAEKNPPTAPATPRVQLCLRCDDVEATVTRATAAGAQLVRPLKTEFHGHRCGSLRDPFGHEWMVFQEIEPLSATEMQARWQLG